MKKTKKFTDNREENDFEPLKKPAAKAVKKIKEFDHKKWSKKSYLKDYYEEE